MEVKLEFSNLSRARAPDLVKLGFLVELKSATLVLLSRARAQQKFLVELESATVELLNRVIAGDLMPSK